MFKVNKNVTKTEHIEVYSETFQTSKMKRFAKTAAFSRSLFSQNALTYLFERVLNNSMHINVVKSSEQNLFNYVRRCISDSVKKL